MGSLYLYVRSRARSIAAGTLLGLQCGLLIGVLTTAGCALPPPTVPTACDQYVSRFVNLNFDLGKVKQWQFSIGLSDEYVQKFETLQGDYTFRARNLCQQQPVYEKAGRLDQYLCMQERLDRSLEQLRVIDLAFKALGSEKEAKDRGPVIKDAVDYYFKQFLTTTPCSKPPDVQRIAEIKAEINKIWAVVNKHTLIIAQRERTFDRVDIQRLVKLSDYREVKPLAESHLPAVVQGLQGVDAGFQAKSYLLISELYARETIWMLDPRNRSSALEKLTLDRRLSSEVGNLAPGDGLPKARERVRNQLAMMSFFSTQRSAIFLPLTKASIISGADERRRTVNDVLKGLETNATKFSSGSYFNFMGTLALANGDNERALKHYYEGFLQDEEHVPVYESLSYTLWRLHGDSRTARRYASRGFDLVQELPFRWREQRKQVMRNLAALEAANPQIKAYSNEVRAFYDTAEPVVSAYLDNFFDRLGSNLAYFNALELVDREPSERIIKEVLARRPANEQDSDFIDSYGFIKLRFARSEADVDEAIRLFNRAKKLATTKDQLDLANAHLDAASKLKEEIAELSR